MKKRLPFFFALFAAFIIGLGGWYINLQRIRQRSALSGFFQTTPAEVSSRTSGRIRQILVHEGDSVQKGEPLLLLNAAPQIEDAKASQEQALEAAAALQETLHGPRQQDIEAQQAAVAAAEASLLQLQHGPRPEDIAQARAKLAQRQAVYEDALQGPRPQDIAAARAAEQKAAADLQQTLRGPTQQARAEARALYRAAAAEAALARRNAQRYRILYTEDAVSLQEYEQYKTSSDTASQNALQLQQAYQRTIKGSTRQQIAIKRAELQQAQASLALVLAGTRPQQIAADKAARDEAAEALKELLAGTRTETLHQAQDELQMQKALLAKLLAGSRQEDIAQRKAAAMAAQALAKSKLFTVSEKVVRAPFTGFVQTIPVAAGDLVNPGEELVEMENPADVWIKVYVPEKKLASVSIGQTAVLRIDGMKQTVLAKVESIAGIGEFTPTNLQTPDERGKQVFAVKLRTLHPHKKIKPGIYATVLRIGGWKP